MPIVTLLYDAGASFTALNKVWAASWASIARIRARQSRADNADCRRSGNTSVSTAERYGAPATTPFTGSRALDHAGIGMSSSRQMGISPDAAHDLELRW